MDSSEQQNKIKQKVEENHLRLKQQLSPLTTSFPPSPPSSTSSPSHEFSFTVSLQQQQHHHHHHQNHSSNNYANTKPLQTNNKIINSNSNNNTFAIDLSPADDIFFHGHLLPLHLLSHLPPVSPRSSTNSVENFTLPVKDLIDDHRNEKSYSDSNILHKKINTSTHDHNNETKGRAKAKSFSIFGLPRWKRGGDGGYRVREGEDKDNKNKKKPRFDVNQVLKRYLRMVRPLLSSFRGIRSRERNRRFDREEYNSFSGNSSFRDKKLSHEFTRGRRRGQYSAPASIRTSPTNSGLLIATPTTSITSSTSDSTMEELQAAIQAAIAHCKNSFAVDDKIKC